jgi:ribosome maturation factor RimP
MVSRSAPPQPKGLIGSKDSAMKESQIAGVLTPVLAQFGLELEAVEIIPAGKRRLVRLVVDGDGPQGAGPLLDDIAEASKAASTALDGADVTGRAPYTLEVTSRGVSRPLELPRHWRRNTGRLVAVRLSEGDAITGRIVSSSEDGVQLDVDGDTREIRFGDVDRALVQVELNRPRAARSEDEEG